MKKKQKSEFLIIKIVSGVTVILFSPYNSESSRYNN